MSAVECPKCTSRQSEDGMSEGHIYEPSEWLRSEFEKRRLELGMSELEWGARLAAVFNGPEGAEEYRKALEDAA